MAVSYNPFSVMTTDFHKEHYSNELSPSSKDIEKVLGLKLDEGTENWLDSITGEEAHKLLK